MWTLLRIPAALADLGCENEVGRTCCFRYLSTWCTLCLPRYCTPMINAEITVWAGGVFSPGLDKMLTLSQSAANSRPRWFAFLLKQTRQHVPHHLATIVPKQKMTRAGFELALPAWATQLDVWEHLRWLPCCIAIATNTSGKSKTPLKSLTLKGEAARL